MFWISTRVLPLVLRVKKHNVLNISFYHIDSTKAFPYTSDKNIQNLLSLYKNLPHFKHNKSHAVIHTLIPQILHLHPKTTKNKHTHSLVHTLTRKNRQCSFGTTARTVLIEREEPAALARRCQSNYPRSPSLACSGGRL